MASPTVIAQKRSSMFSQLGNDQVWQKNTPGTLIYALLDAIAKEHGNFQDEVDCAHDDLFLSTIARVDNLQAEWGDMLQENIRGDITWQQNVTIWQQMLKLIVWGLNLNGVQFRSTTRAAITQLILDYSLVSGCKIFEFWSSESSFVGAQILADALKWNSTTNQWNQGIGTQWLDSGTLKKLAYVPSGFQVFPEITGYTRDTNVIEYAAKMMTPAHNVLAFVWMLTLAQQAAGFDTQIAYMQLGSGAGAGPGCTTPVVTEPIWIDNLNTLKYVVPGPTSFKRASAIVRDADLPVTVDITEACLLNSSMVPIAGTYQTFSAVHKIAGFPTAVGYYIPEAP